MTIIRETNRPAVVHPQTVLAATVAALTLLVLALPASPVAAAAAPGNVFAQGAPLPSTFGLRFGPDGRLYVASFGAGIVVLDPETGQVVGLLGPEQGVVGPEDLAFGPDGSLYWAEMFTGYVGRRPPSGVVTKQMVAPGVNPLAFSGDGRLFVSVCWWADLLVELDPNLVAPPKPILDGLGWFKGIAFGPDGKLYGASVQSGTVLRIDLAAQPPSVETVAAGFGRPFTAKLDSQGRLLVIDRLGFDLLRVDPVAGSKQLVARLPFGPDNVAIGPRDRLFLSSYSDSGIYEVLPDGSVRTVLPGGLVLPEGTAVVPRADGESLLVACQFSLREYDTATGSPRGVERQTFAPAPAFAGSSTVAADGEKAILTSFFPSPGVQVRDLKTGATTEHYGGFASPINAVRFRGDLVVIDLGTEAGAARVLRLGAGGRTVLADASDDITLPVGLAATDESLFVSDWAAGVVWQLAASGSVLSTPRPVAHGLKGPKGMAVDRDGSLLVVEGNAGRLSRVDPATGGVRVVAAGLALGMPGFGVLPPYGVVGTPSVSSSGSIFVPGELGNVVYRLTPRTFYVPAAAHASGLGGSAWRTELGIHNRGTVQAGYTVELLETGKANAAPKSISFLLDPGNSARYPDAVASLFQHEGAGALRVTSTSGDLLVTSSTSDERDGPRLGPLVEAIPVEQALASGQEARLVHLANANGRRTDVGIVNASGTPLTVEIELWRSDGTPLGTRSLFVSPFGQAQQDDVFGHLTTSRVSAAVLAGVDDAWAKVTSTTPGARYFAWATVIDNASGGAMFVPAR
jgi:sugar lactone lactonase YvrE